MYTIRRRKRSTKFEDPCILIEIIRVLYPEQHVGLESGKEPLRTGLSPTDHINLKIHSPNTHFHRSMMILLLHVESHAFCTPFHVLSLIR